ncbi:DNA-binding transcriptional regulator, LysR family [Pseudovibrio ascidiaceicola]|uniref:DNA-binding transcriptional regulator, LysR family n=1 Tax=Pseudovibrio ascidiaceicola TaxID=285279 RepID=A0A1I3WL22_9HYPH|nr:LysR substrate-binding domain-containing protein [Pseudovibrio ascidiaceicola]SFK07889.1 DNA-binding transcriptional regulator, LysR family [Pseudovibrio ascidiaceicola]
MPHLDSDLLRTFLAVRDTGSILAGAERIHRTQSAVSVQIRKLEELLGKAVFVRHGRGVRLTAAGERLEPVARKVVRELNDIFAELTGAELAGVLRIGVPDDYSSELLLQIIAEFARDNPKVELNVQRSLSTGYSAALASGQMDIAVHEVAELGLNMEPLKNEQVVWAASRAHAVHEADPLPVALFDRDCWWRDMAVNALNESGKTYRVVYSSESATGVAAAVRAGVAVGVLRAGMLGADITPLSAEQGFPALPASKLVIEFGSNIDTKTCGAMADAIRKAFAGMR